MYILTPLKAVGGTEHTIISGSERGRRPSTARSWHGPGTEQNLLETPPTEHNSSAAQQQLSRPTAAAQHTAAAQKQFAQLTESAQLTAPV